MSNNYVVVPARGGSKGIHKKNLSEVLNKKLVIRSMVHGQSLAEKNNIILSTDSLEIISEVKNFFNISDYEFEPNTINRFGQFRLHFRDDSLSCDQTLITEVLFEINKLLKQSGEQPIAFCLLQPTSPFRSKKELKTINKFLNGNFDSTISLVSFCSVKEMHPARMYLPTKNGKMIPLPGFESHNSARRQDLPNVYIRDGGYYVIGESLIHEKKQFCSEPIGFVRGLPWSINIDCKEDLVIAQHVLRSEVHEDPNEG